MKEGRLGCDDWKPEETYLADGSNEAFMEC
jgi:hypothetical protein